MKAVRLVSRVLSSSLLSSEERMKVKYEIVKAEPAVEWMQIKFTNDDGQEYWKNIMHVDWSPEGVRECVESFGPEIVAHWERVKGVNSDAVSRSIQSSGEFEAEPENFFIKMPPTPVIAEEPEFDVFTQRIEQDEYEVGDETIEWKVIDLTPAEAEEFMAETKFQLTSQRNYMLAVSDWIFAPDVNVENMDEWLAYRQELRDVTEQPGFPKDFTWPKHPLDER